MNTRVAAALRVLAVVFCVLALVGSFAMSFQTWVAIGTLAGFGALAVAMPLCVDGHVMTALTTWLSPVSEQLARFARANLYAVGAASVLAQSTYHAAITWQRTGNQALTVLALGAGAFPPVVATLAAHLAVGIVREAFTVDATTEQPQRSRIPEQPAPATSVAAIPAEPTPQPSQPLTPLSAPRLPTLPAPLSPALSAVPSLSIAPSSGQTSPARKVTVDDVRGLAHLDRAQIARHLGCSLATVDRRLRDLRVSA